MTELYKALLSVQSLQLKAKKDTQAYNYKYADLEEVWSVLSKPLKDNGLVVIQNPQRDVLETVVAHAESGEKVVSELHITVSDESKNHMQDLGSAITYARRYALCSMFNIITNDDDNQNLTTEAPTPKASASNPPSDKQLDLARSLLTKQGFPAEAIEARLEKVESSVEASALVKNLLASAAKK